MMGLLWHTALVFNACSNEVAFTGSPMVSHLYETSQNEPFFITQIMPESYYLKLQHQSQIYQINNNQYPEIVITKNQSDLPPEILSVNEIRRNNKDFMISISEMTSDIELDRQTKYVKATTQWDQFKMLSVFHQDEIQMLATAYQLQQVTNSVISHHKPRSIGTAVNSSSISKTISNHLDAEIKNIYNLIVFKSIGRKQVVQ
jgi:hypothetical protein